MAIVGAAVLLLASGDTAALGAALIAGSLLVIYANIFIRLSISSQDDRDREASERRDREQRR